MAKKDNVNKIAQITESHCGPAVIKMLLSVVGVESTQKAITRAAGATKTIEAEGTSMEQLAKAVRKIAPSYKYWVKYHSSMKDIKFILDQDYPVGISWQGIFEDEDEEDTERLKTGDYGHYSIVKELDTLNGVMIIADPYMDFANDDRIIAIEKFKNRWFDYDPILETDDPKKEYRKHERLIFIITPKKETFPTKLGMKSLY